MPVSPPPRRRHARAEVLTLTCDGPAPEPSRLRPPSSPTLWNRHTTVPLRPPSWDRHTTVPLRPPSWNRHATVPLRPPSWNRHAAVPPSSWQGRPGCDDPAPGPSRLRPPLRPFGTVIPRSPLPPGRGGQGVTTPPRSRHASGLPPLLTLSYTRDNAPPLWNRRPAVLSVLPVSSWRERTE